MSCGAIVSFGEATAKPGGISTSGDAAVLGRLMSLIGNPDPDVAIVTP